MTPIEKAVALFEFLPTADHVASFLKGIDAKGWQGSAEMCPIANALKILMKGDLADVDTISVSPRAAYVLHYKEMPSRYPLPDQVAEFIEAFDRGEYSELQDAPPSFL